MPSNEQVPLNQPVPRPDATPGPGDTELMGRMEALGVYLTKLHLTQSVHAHVHAYTHTVLGCRHGRPGKWWSLTRGSRVGRVAGVQKWCWAEHGRDESGRGVKTASKSRLGVRQGGAGVLQAGKGQPGGGGAEAVEGSPEPAE